MSGPDPTSPWSALAAGWEDLFPLRPPRLDLALHLSAPGDRCLDAGCATGSLPRALAARGRVAHGLDLDLAFLAVARQKALAEHLDVTWHHADLLDLAGVAGDARFQLITCLGQTLPHLLEEDQWRNFFTQAREVLQPGGYLVIQVVNDAGMAMGQTRDLPPLQTPAGALARRRTLLTPTQASFETVFTPHGAAPITHHSLHRRARPDEAADLLRQAGLDPGLPLADETRQPFQESSPGWILIASRRD